MADGSAIGWLTDADGHQGATWNYITGCSVKDSGCRECYAMKLAGTRLQHHPSRAGLTIDTAAGPVWTGEVRLNEYWLLDPVKYRRGRSIFPVAHGDLFHEKVPQAWQDMGLAVMLMARQHTYKVLTKRVDVMEAYIRGLGTPEGRQRLLAAAAAISKMPAVGAGRTGSTRDLQLDLDALTPFFEGPRAGDGRLLPNIWLGCSVDNQSSADGRREAMRSLAERGWLTWVSYEPAHGLVDWSGWEFLRWLVAGGESGLRAQAPEVAWFRAARDWCYAHGVAFNMKQWGAFLPPGHGGPGRKGRWAIFNDTDQPIRVGSGAAGRTLDGVIHDAFPDRTAKLEKLEGAA